MAHANETRDWRIYLDFAKVLIDEARRLYADEDLGLHLDQTAYALDATTIDLCLSLFPWAKFRKAKGAIRLHTLMDLRGSIPTMIVVSHGKIHETSILKLMTFEPGAIYVMDRGYVDFTSLYRIDQSSAFFVVRCKNALRFKRRYSHPIDKATGLQSDQTVVLTTFYPRKNYPDALRRVRYRDPETGVLYTFLTNNVRLPALTIAQLYRRRWQIELFFKWIKQHLRIKAFYGTSENAVKTQVWIAISVYALVAIAKKRMELDLSLYTILQILSVSLFGKAPVLQVFSNRTDTERDDMIYKQLTLFD